MQRIRTVTVLVTLLTASLVFSAAGALAQGTWTATNHMTAARSGQTATLLANGKVLVAGGENLIGNVRTAELYNPSTGSWALTGNNPNVPRALASAARLNNGKVLVAGGCNTDCVGALSSSELYDPSILPAGRWILIRPMATARFSFTATLLTSGKVLVAGGCTMTNCTSETNKAELYNPATGTWTATGSMKFGRGNHTATRLSNGMVLVAGGISSSADTNSAELYNPTTGTWTSVGNMHYTHSGHIAVFFPSTGKVLVAGGGGPADTLAGAELYNPSTKAWTVTTGTLRTGRDDFSAVLLQNGKVLVAGGANLASNAVRSAELYNPTTGTWSYTGSMATARIEFTLTLLTNGQALAAGGTDGVNAFYSDAELYHP